MAELLNVSIKMENHIATNPDQSELLMNLGFNTDGAHMTIGFIELPPNRPFYHIATPYREVVENNQHAQGVKWLPAWTLGDLLELIPSYLPETKVKGYCLELYRHSVIYSCQIGFTSTILIHEQVDSENKTMIDVLVKVIKQVKDYEKSLIENGKEDLLKRIEYKY